MIETGSDVTLCWTGRSALRLICLPSPVVLLGVRTEATVKRYGVAVAMPRGQSPAELGEHRSQDQVAQH